MQDFVSPGSGRRMDTAAIPEAVRTPDYVGIAMLYMVAISRKGK